MPTAGVAATRSRCRWCMRGRAQMPSICHSGNRPCAVPVPRIHCAGSTAPLSVLPPLPHCEGASPFSRMVAEALCASSRLGPQGVPISRATQVCLPEGTRHPVRPDFMPEHSDDPGCADLTDSQECVPEGTSHPRGRDLAIPLPEDVGRPAGPTEPAAAAAWISGEQIAYRSNTAAAGCRTPLLARPRRGPGGLPTETDATDARV